MARAADLNAQQAKEVWDSLSDLQRQFVIARLGSKTDTAAAKLIGVPVQSVSNWGGIKEQIDAYIKYCRNNAVAAAQQILTESLIEASSVLRHELKGRRRMTAAKEILDRGGLPATTRQELGGVNGGAIGVKYVDYRNGIATTEAGPIPDSDPSGEV